MLGAKPAELTYREVPKRVEAILQLHANYKAYTKEVAARSLKTFVDELDTSKSYLTAEDIPEVLAPTDKQLDQVVHEYAEGKFSVYEQIYEKMAKAIERRRQFEKELTIPVGQHVNVKELKDPDWAKNVDELKERLVKLRILQLQVAKKLDPDEEKKTIQLIEKHRKTYEDDLLITDAKVKEQVLATTITKAIAKALDSQTMFFTPWEAKQFLIGVQQRLYGIGVLLRDDLDGFSVIKLVEGGPAEQVGHTSNPHLKLKDKIVAVNGEPVVGIDVVDAVEKIRGPEGTSVQLTVLREGTGLREGFESEEAGVKENSLQRLTIVVPRGEVVMKESRYEITTEAFGDGVIATVALHSFYQDQESSSSADLLEALKKLQKKYQVKGMLLDLRSNPGGLMTEAVSVAGLFIKKGVVVSVRDENGRVQHMRNFDTFRVWDGPLIVLVNKASASAAEIVAQTLQDYGRAIIVGDTTTFGKGSFQQFTLNPSNEVEINPKGEFKVTRGCYYTPSGKSPQLQGVSADVVVPGAMAEAEVGERFSEFPLQASSIAPSFRDTLSDIPFFERQQIKKVYLNNLEEPTTLWSQYILALKINSEQRQQANKGYGTFLEKAKNASEDIVIAEELAKEEDFQGREGLNILRDLVYFENIQRLKGAKDTKDAKDAIAKENPQFLKPQKGEQKAA